MAFNVSPNAISVVITALIQTISLCVSFSYSHLNGWTCEKEKKYRKQSGHSGSQIGIQELQFYLPKTVIQSTVPVSCELRKWNMQYRGNTAFAYTKAGHVILLNVFVWLLIFVKYSAKTKNLNYKFFLHINYITIHKRECLNLVLFPFDSFPYSDFFLERGKTLA